MFCFQCEQTSKGTGCTTVGVCGKDPETAILQDVLLHGTKAVAQYAYQARSFGATDAQVDRVLARGLFLTVTNVNFDATDIERAIRDAVVVRDQARALYETAARKAGRTPVQFQGPATWVAGPTRADLLGMGKMASILSRREAFGPDISALQELLTYGLKGVSAYTEHARILGRETEAVYAFMAEALNYLAEGKPTLDGLLALCLRCGECNLKAMEALDAAHTSTYGHPVPTPVRVTPLKGKAILISGHDMKDLELLLLQTEGKGINIYTHGEMIPAHGYPGLKKYKHLVGNYGGAWQNQKDEFANFPGAILINTNCIQKPAASYRKRIFTCGHVGWPGVTHIANHDFSPAIQAALEAPGFSEDGPNKTILVGFGHNAVLGVADKVVEAVKTGALKRFFLIAGCDGARSKRAYYTELAQSVPKDCVVLTLACGKYRFNQLEFGSIGGIPRLLDVGQCNDAYSAIQVALALSKAFGCGVNDLPLSLVLSWYEQKAVAVLLTLLFLGVRNIRLGPTLPAFVSPNVLNVLVDKFNLMPIKTAKADLKAILGNAA
jgi:hydroxylamine reductase